MMRCSLPLLCIFLLFTNCNGTKQANDKNNEGITPILANNYIITSINGKSLDHKGLSMNFDRSTNNVSGKGGCNNYFGRFKQEENSILFNKISATKKYCQDSEIRKLEEELFAVLPKIESFNGTNSGNITFYDDQLNSVLSIALVN